MLLFSTNEIVWKLSWVGKQFVSVYWTGLTSLSHVLVYWVIGIGSSILFHGYVVLICFYFPPCTLSCDQKLKVDLWMAFISESMGHLCCIWPLGSWRYLRWEKQRLKKTCIWVRKCLGFSFRSTDPSTIPRYKQPYDQRLQELFFLRSFMNSNFLCSTEIILH